MARMRFSKHPILKWLPALLMMLAIFLFSATPSKDIQPSVLRYIFYKGGHVIGYTMLVLSYWRACDFSKKSISLAWLFALLYALTDEYHQSLVPGRHPALFDVLVYDNAGALIAAWIANYLTKQKQPIHEGLIAASKTVTP